MKSRYKYAALEVITPLVAILFAILVGSLVMMAIKKDPVKAYKTMFEFGFGRMDSVAIILFKATPLIFSGLAVAIGFRVGLFNIGVEGQYFIGALFASIVGFSLKGLPTFIHLPLVLLAGIAGGVIWSLLPVILKTRRGVHEVITTIMMNYIAYSLVHYFVADVFLDPGQQLAPGLGSPRVRMPLIADSARMPTLHGFLALFGVTMPKHVYLNWFLPLGLLAAVAFYYLIWRTPTGFEIRAVGHNAAAAEAAGVKSEKVVLKAFLMSGAVAGLVGMSNLLAYIGYLDIDFPKGIGFTGIAVALLGKNHPLGIVLAALLFGFLDRGAEGVQVFEGVPMDTIVILQGVMILSIVIAAEIMGRYIKRQSRKEGVA